jgi:hypothetical protein
MYKKHFISKTILFIIIVIAIIILIFPIFIPTIRGTNDGFSHKFRAVSFIKSIQEGNIRPRWLADQALGFGTPTFMYNFSVPYYAVALINTFIHSIQKSSQLYASVIVIVTFISMFLLAHTLYGYKSGLLTALAYISAPYFLLSLYTYEAWGEMTSFLFPPLILYQGIKLIEKLDTKRAMLFVTTWVIFVNTHNCSILESALPLCILLLVYSHHSGKNLLYIFHLLCSSALISSFFWLPAIVLTNLIKFNELINYEIDVRWTQYKHVVDFITVSLDALRKNETNYYSFTPGLLIIVTLVIVLAVFLRLSILKLLCKKSIVYNQIFFAITLFLLTIISIVLTTDISSVVWKTGILNLILYPYRFLFVATFTGTLLFGWLIKKMTNNWLLIVFCVLIVIFARPFTNNPSIDLFTFDDHYFENSPQLIRYAYGTYKNMGTMEFLPIWVNRDFIQNQDSLFIQTQKLPEKITLNKDDGAIVSKKILSEKMTFNLLMNKSEDIVVNTFYYPNWIAMVNNIRVPVIPDGSGRILVHVPKGDVKLSLIFGYSNIERFSFVLSIVGIIYLALILYRLNKHTLHS